jgi:uroporphyrinogen-III synthase
MRILVTRPEPDARKTADRLRALGHDPVIAPLLSVIFESPPADLPEPAALLLTSRNAAWAVSRWPQASRWHDRPVFVTGRGTAEAATAAGFVDVRSADGDANDLARLLMRDIGPQVRPVLHPAARDRSGTFLKELRCKGYDIRTIEAYRAELASAFDPEVREALHSGAISAVLIYSRRTAEAFRQAVERVGLIGELAELTLYVLSTRVAEPILDLDANIVVADRPDEDSLLSRLPAVKG